MDIFKNGRWHSKMPLANFKRGFRIIKILKKKELNASNFMPEDLLEIICILERVDLKRQSYKIIRKRNYFSLITKFPARNGESTPLKNSASAQRTATHQDKQVLSSDGKLRKNKRRKRKRNKSSPRNLCLTTVS